MPSRIIRESAKTSPTLDQLSYQAECLFWRLTVTADDHGRFDADPRVLLSSCFPLRAHRLKPARIEKWRDEMVAAGLIVLYQSGDRTYGCFPTWGKYQRVRSKDSKYPPPPASADIRGHPPSSADKCGQMPSEGMGYGVGGMGKGEGRAAADGREPAALPNTGKGELPDHEEVLEFTKACRNGSKVRTPAEFSKAFHEKFGLAMLEYVERSGKSLDEGAT